MRDFGSELTLLGGDPGGQWSVRLHLLERMQNLIILTKDNRIVFINAAGLGWFAGPTSATMLGTPVDAIFHSDYGDLVSLGMDALSEEAMIPLKLVGLDGGAIDVEMRVCPVDGADSSVYMIEARDITEHLRSARALRLREQRLEGIINTVADGIITIDDCGLIQTFNPAAETIFRFDAIEIVGKSIRLLMPDPIADSPEAELGVEWQRILRTGGEVEGRRSDGGTFPMEIAVREMVQGAQVAYTSVVRDITARKLIEERILHQAHHDHLTGLPNRILFTDRLEAAILRAERRDRKVMLVFVDLNRFKPINDTYGHAVGDDVLRAVAVSMTQALRRSDTVARLGGDEFVAVLEEIGNRDDAEKVVLKIMQAVTVQRDFAGLTLQVGASVGVALVPDDAAAADILTERADRAMYRVKETGHSGYCFHGDDAVHEYVPVVDEV